jgi:serine/threonine protein kinase
VACANIGFVRAGSPEGRVGRYELLEEIGRGMSAVVYRAHDPELDRRVAVKIIDLPPVSGPEQQAFEGRVLEEARLAGRLSHPGIVIVHDVGKEPRTGRLFIVFEHVEGQTLAERLAGGSALADREALRVIGRLAEALQHAHAAGVIHRDIRPANIVLTPSGDPKLMDVGVARLETSRMTLTSIRQAFGAPLYMSPEQAVGEHLDARTDIFSLGAVAYRLLAGRDAFAAEDPREILALLVHQTPPPPSAFAPGLPPGVDAAVAHALAKSRKDRYLEARQFAEDVEDILGNRAPRNSQDRDAGGGTERFHAALAAASRGAATPRPGSEHDGGDLTVRGRRRAAVRGAAGVAALALVVALELLRRSGEAPVPATAPLAPPTSSPRLSPPSRSATALDPSLPSINRDIPDPTKARVLFELSYTLKSGRLRVSVDGDNVVDESIAAPHTKTFLGVATRAARLHRTLELEPGRRRIDVQVLWGKEQRNEAITLTLKPGTTRRVSADIGGMSKSLSLEEE